MMFQRYVVSANLAMLSTGLSVGWTLSFVPKMLSGHEQIKMTNAQSLWMEPLMLFGVILGGTVSVLTINRIGRKKTLLLTVPTYIISWLLIAVAQSPTEIMCSRGMSGFGSSICFCATAVYLSEIAAVRSRGAVCATQLFSYELGSLLANIGGLFLDMKMQALISAILPIVFIFLFFYAPETPYYLMLQGHYDMAQKSLAQYRGPKDVVEEMKMIANTIEHDFTGGRRFVDLFLLRSNRRSLIIVLLLVLFRYFAGSDNVHHRAAIMFNDAGFLVDEKYLSILFDALKICNSLLIITVVDDSRKSLLLLSTISAGVTTFVVGAYYVFRETRSDIAMFGGVAMAAEICFTLMFSPSRFSFLLAGELFTTTMKGYATALLAITIHIAYYATLNAFQYLSNDGNIYMVLFCSSILGMSSVFILCSSYMPETNRKTLLEIQDLLKQAENFEETPSRRPTLSMR